ncbi:sensor histidine kinase KdpD [Microbacterium sp. SORGH_AS_0888]|uniref:sensor histidine kinase n=1 Tax=Microbacterium sp. SORGH_AS_0888 TaxID=3041791 RepID=UPI002780BC0E|nr:HAMP domain-containing sensor histidine kinase [Microbacterium sp. SORGH_AS_0888]MDQ1130033.1 signal transduction histidine kinase [Microbacterium sp. SORGH_AS_0888]
MIALADLSVIAVTALVCTALAMGIALLLLRLARARSLAVHVGIIIAAVLSSVAGSTLAISLEMYLSAHDLTVLLWVLGIAAAFGAVGGWILVRSLRRTVAMLGTAARRIGDGEIVRPGADSSRELRELSAEIARSSERLAAARAEVERLDASRRQLVAWISHDLRTPLAGIHALAEALEQRGEDADLAYLRQIRVQTDLVGRMVDGLFELSKIQSGTLRLQKEPVVLMDLISDTVSEMQPIAAARGIRISRSGVGDVMLIADPRELSRVVSNLLSNSVQHAPEGSEILVSTLREDGDRIVVSVWDSGPGVATEDLGRMFEAGWRADTARAHAAPGVSSGAGLGLAIVQGIVEAHGGAVRAARADGGFRLDVVLPAAP